MLLPQFYFQNMRFLLNFIDLTFGFALTQAEYLSSQLYIERYVCVYVYV